MSEQQGGAFDDWEQVAEEMQKQDQTQKQQPKKQISQLQINEFSDQQNQQIKSQKQVPVDPKKTLVEKIQQYKKLTPEQFQQKYANVSENSKNAATKIGNPVLKSDKDFSNYAKSIVKRFDNLVVDQNATLDDDKLSLFVEELILYTYNNLEWKNLHEITNKIKVIKKQRKTQQQKMKKQKQKQQRQKKINQLGSQTKSQNKKLQKKEDDLFGGAGQMNSKQQQELRKNKVIVEVKKKVESDDDDDFM